MCLDWHANTTDHGYQGYFRLSPSQVAAYWIAVDETDAENGCISSWLPMVCTSDVTDLLHRGLRIPFNTKNYNPCLK